MNELIKPGDIFNFTKDIFLSDYYDKEGDKPKDVIILNIMQYGALYFDNKLIKSNFTFNISEINKLKYYRISNLSYSEIIEFKVSDNNPNKKYSDMATFTINVNAYENLPPNQVGDNELTLDNGESIVFTTEDFTTNTTPPYSDPEGDGPYKLKITKLPTDGSKLKLNNNNVTLNQEILFTDIELGLLVLEPTLNDNAHTLDFEFDISDLGSEEYSGL